jgi:aminocarboxymuconate-semialdehyde decarboxylase
MTGVVDVHTHLTPRCFIDGVQKDDVWYGMTEEDGELDNPKNLWTIERRLEEMDRLGVDAHMISPTDVFYQYNQKPEITAKIARLCNEEIAGLAKKYPNRILGLGTLPMQDMDLAVAEMEHGVGKLGLWGFMMDDHVNGVTYDNPVFNPFWESVERLGAFLLVHQYGPTVTETRTRKYFLHNSVGNLVDRTLTFGCLVGGGVMDRYPGLKICLGYAGGYVPYAVDRMDKSWLMFPKYRGEADKPPSAYLDRFYYDSTTFTDRNLRFLVDVVGSDRVVLGSDFPAPMAVNDPVGAIKHSPTLSEEEKQAILWRNMDHALR